MTKKLEIGGLLARSAELVVHGLRNNLDTIAKNLEPFWLDSLPGYKELTDAIENFAEQVKGRIECLCDEKRAKTTIMGNMDTISLNKLKMMAHLWDAKDYADNKNLENDRHLLRNMQDIKIICKYKGF